MYNPHTWRYGEGFISCTSRNLVKSKTFLNVIESLKDAHPTLTKNQTEELRNLSLIPKSLKIKTRFGLTLPQAALITNGLFH